MSDTANLKARWRELWRRIGVLPEKAPTMEPLLAAYQSPPRAYHNLRHIEQCLRELDSARRLCGDPDAVEIAIWYHDAVYDAKRGDNEERSADLAANALQSAGVATERVQAISSLILVTRHSAAPVGNDAQLLVDVDLSILGQLPAVFDDYESAIRAEYAHVDEQAFREGRAKILRRFVDRPRIFLTGAMHDRYEAQARRNLARSLQSLLSVR